MEICKLGICFKSLNNTFWTNDVRAGLEDQARRSNVLLDVVAPPSIADLNQQKQLIEQLVYRCNDVIAFAPSDPTLGVEIVQELNRRSIPVIVFDTALNYLDPREASLAYTFVKIDDEAGGRATALYHQHLFADGAEVLLIDGFGSNGISPRIKSYIDNAPENFTIQGIVRGDFEEDRAFDLTIKQLTLKPSINLIFACSDNMALGAANALRALGRNDVLISGFDATFIGRHALRNGTLISTFDTQPEMLGREVVIQAFGLKDPQVNRSTHTVYGSLLTRDFFKPLPKQVISIRSYPMVAARSNTSEFEYNTLENNCACPIVFGENYLEDIPNRLRELDSNDLIIISDHTVRKIYGQALAERMNDFNLPTRIFSFPAGEKNKNMQTIEALSQDILNVGLTKRSVIVSFGGGIVNNVAGFIATTLMRGIRLVHVPTSTMAQLDVVVGGKQAVNTPHGKNLLGTYYEPEFIYVNHNFIKTLPKREYLNGIAEAVKHGICQSNHLLQLLESGNYLEILRETLRLKISLLDRDPREKNSGLILLYGHTLGHALEIASGHELLHGEAISIGMYAAAHISNKLGYCSADFVKLHKTIFQYHRLPTQVPRSVPLDLILNTLPYDKKDRRGDVRFFLMRDIGVPVIKDGEYAQSVPQDLLLQVLEDELGVQMLCSHKA